MFKDKNAIMIADTRAWLVGHLLLQIKDTNKYLFDEAIIYYNNYSENDIKTISSIMPCRFIEYKSPIPEKLFNLPQFERFSPIMFVRYEIFNHIEEYDNIMWIDTDVLIQGDLSPLIDEVKKTGYAMLCENPEHKSSEKVDYVRTNFFEPNYNYNMDEYLLCTGTILINNKFNKKADYTKWCYEKTIEWANNLNLPDQGVINALIQEFNIKVTPIGHGGLYGCYPKYGRNCDKAIYIHSWGSNKFWNDWYLFNKFPKWKTILDKWIEISKTPIMNDIKPDISVVIPTYKPDIGYFKQCLDSLINQEKNDWEGYTNFEILIISEPFYEDEIKDFVNSYNDPRIHLIFNKEKLGISASLNKGIRLAKGEYILRIDDDDIASPKRFIKQLNYLRTNKEYNLCASDYNYFGDMNEGRRIFDGEMSRAWSIFTCPFDHPTIMFNKDFFVSNNLFYDENRKFVEDWELWLRAFDKGLKVGTIHEVLTYHRWHNGSASQTNNTVEMMQELIKLNFNRLNIYIKNEHLKFIGPWSGKLSDDEYHTLEKIFYNAKLNNYSLKIYDPYCLEKVFQIRLLEAKTGKLPSVNIEITREESIVLNNIIEKKSENPSKNFIKKIIKKIFKPFYAPIRHRFEDKIINIERLIWNLTCDVSKLSEKNKSEFDNIKMILEFNDIKNKDLVKFKDFLDLQKEFNDMKQIVSEIEENQNYTKKYFEYIIKEEIKEIIDAQTSKLINDINEYSLDGNENIMRVIGGRIRESELYNENILDKKTQDIHRHTDFLYRDVMVVLEMANNFIKKENLDLITDFPIAYESNDHKFPHGTIRDNTRYPRFVSKCEKLFENNKKLSFLDLGCSGGGMVLDAALKGHFSMGLEGSDISYKQQRAEWRLLGDNLKTCDITKPFKIVYKSNEDIYKFDIITAWEVLEHIKEEDLKQLFDNIYLHLSDEGRFIASIANWADIDPITGIDWHVTQHNYEWWKNKFEENGFIICTDEFDTIDLARGGYNPPHCYEEPYKEIDIIKGFHIVVKKNS